MKLNNDLLKFIKQEVTDNEFKEEYTFELVLSDSIKIYYPYLASGRTPKGLEIWDSWGLKLATVRNNKDMGTVKKILKIVLRYYKKLNEEVLYDFNTLNEAIHKTGYEKRSMDDIYKMFENIKQSLGEFDIDLLLYGNYVKDNFFHELTIDTTTCIIRIYNSYNREQQDFEFRSLIPRIKKLKEQIAKDYDSKSNQTKGDVK